MTVLCTIARWFMEVIKIGAKNRLGVAIRLVSENAKINKKQMSKYLNSLKK